MTNNNSSKALTFIFSIAIPLLISLFTIFVSDYYFRKTFKATEIGRLNDNLNKLLDINFNYPYLSDSSFISRWDNDEVINLDSSYRYQTYCEYVYNFLANVSNYYDYNKKSVENFVDIKSITLLNKGWWKKQIPDSTQINHSYPSEFTELVGSYIK